MLMIGSCKTRTKDEEDLDVIMNPQSNCIIFDETLSVGNLFLSATVDLPVEQIKTTQLLSAVSI